MDEAKAGCSAWTVGKGDLSRLVGQSENSIYCRWVKFLFSQHLVNPQKGSNKVEKALIVGHERSQALLLSPWEWRPTRILLWKSSFAKVTSGAYLANLMKVAAEKQPSVNPLSPS